MADVAWIGMGRMGLPMAQHLVKAGHTVRGFDVNPASMERAAEAGISASSSLQEAVGGADFVVTMLPDGADVLKAYGGPDGILANAKGGACLLDCSTISIDACARLHTMSQEAGCVFVDAPVSGGTMGAEAGTLTFMLGGDDEAVNTVRDLIQPMASHIFHTGGATTGQAAKICNNLILFINLASTAEGASLADRLGLDREVFWKLASVSSADSWPLRNWYPMPGVIPEAASSRGFDDPTFTARLAHKDVSLAVDEAKRVMSSATLGKVVQGFYQELIDSGRGEKDCSIVSELM
jgi:3-hydroxyisobutyrate dehydrogenase